MTTAICAHRYTLSRLIFFIAIPLVAVGLIVGILALEARHKRRLKQLGTSAPAVSKTVKESANGTGDEHPRNDFVNRLEQERGEFFAIFTALCIAFVTSIGLLSLVIVIARRNHESRDMASTSSATSLSGRDHAAQESYSTGVPARSNERGRVRLSETE